MADTLPPSPARAITRMILLCLLTAGCESSQPAPPAPTGPPQLVAREKVAMGSALRLSAWTADADKANSIFEDIFREFDRLENVLSVWRPASEVVRLNQFAGDHPVPIGDELRAILQASRQASELTNGKFDITFGALSDIWKFDHDQDNVIPDAGAIRARLPLVDYTLVQVDAAASQAFITTKGARIHLGGIGKGYAVDRAVDFLRGAGFRDFMVQSGGDLYAGGLNNGKPWRLGIADPRNSSGPPFATIDISDGTLSTSGDYERYFLRNGVRYHHILDPDTGQPARLCRSVSIVSKSALLSDWVSTGVFILGPADGMALIEKLNDVDGVIVSSKNEVLVSSGLKGRIQLLSKPTDAP